jgi:DNA-binding response OmpR family regulator
VKPTHHGRRVVAGVSLTKQELALARALYQESPRIVPTEELVRVLGADGTTTGRELVTNYVYRLRRKLGHVIRIDTVLGRGYRMVTS